MEPTCLPNADVAGEGVVVSFIFMALVTCLITTIQFVTDPENDILPRFGNDVHRRLKDAILGLDTTQFTTSCAIVAATFGSYGGTEDYHTILALGLAILATCSQMVPLLTLSHTKHMAKSALYFRLLLGIAQNIVVLALFFTGVRVTKIGQSEYFDVFTSSELLVFMLCVYFSLQTRLWCAWCAIVDTRSPVHVSHCHSAYSLTRVGTWAVESTRHIRSHSKLRELGLWTGIGTAWATTCLTTVYIGYAKYDYEPCNMHDSSSNNSAIHHVTADYEIPNPDTDWTFGQFLAVAMLVAIPFSLVEAILKGMGEKDGEGPHSPEQDGDTVTLVPIANRQDVSEVSIV